MKMSPHSPLKDLPIKKLVLLARHLCRIAGFLTLRDMFEYFPSIDMKSALFIVDTLVASNTIKRTSAAYYQFVDLGKEIKTSDLEEELKVLADVKEGVLKSVCLNIPPSILDAKSAESFTEKKAHETETAKNIRNSTMLNQGGKETNIVSPLQKANFNGSVGQQKTPVKVASLPQNTIPIHKSVLKRNEDFKNPAAPSYPAYGKNPAEDRFFDAELKRKLDSCVRPPPPMDSVPVATVAPSPAIVSPARLVPNVMQSGSIATPLFLASIARKMQPASSSAATIAQSSPTITRQASTATISEKTPATTQQASTATTSQSTPTTTQQVLTTTTAQTLPRLTAAVSQPKSIATSSQPDLPDATSYRKSIAVAPRLAPTATSSARHHVSTPHYLQPVPVAPHVNTPKTTALDRNPSGGSTGQRSAAVLPTQRGGSAVTCRPYPLVPPSSQRQTGGTTTSSVIAAPLPYGSQIRSSTEAADQFHWKKTVSGDEVKDPGRAVEVYCELNKLKPPEYTVTYMPNDNVYYCLVLVDSVSYKSYPTMALTKKRAMEVAAEKAVKSLGITESMISKIS